MDAQVVKSRGDLSCNKTLGELKLLVMNEFYDGDVSCNKTLGELKPRTSTTPTASS